MTGFFDPLPHGVEILDLDDLIERAQLAAADAKDAADTALTFMKAEMAGATAGGVTLSAVDLQAVVTMLETAAALSRATHEATLNVALARLQGVR